MASKIAEKEADAAARRLASVANHLSPGSWAPGFGGGVELANTSMDDSYHRIHGQVPNRPVVWRTAQDESGKEFVDIIYEKSVGEGIAKVSPFDFWSAFSNTCLTFIALIKVPILDTVWYI